MAQTANGATGFKSTGTSGPLGLVAGWGRYPVFLAEALRRDGYEVYCVGVWGEADPGLAEKCKKFQWIGLGKLGQAIRFFQQYGVRQVLMAGKVHKTHLFQPWAWVRHFPDWHTIRLFIPHLLTRRKDCRDDTILRAIVDAFAAEGIQIRPPTELVPELLLGPGQLTDRAPTPWQWKDIQFGWRIAKHIGALDIGQTVVVKDQAVLAVEAIEGTDACIRRAGSLCPAGGFTVVKVAKPQQDMRFDVPTIGLGTLESIRSAGGAVLAVEAHRTILVEHDQFLRQANQAQLVVVALEASAILDSPSGGIALEPIAEYLQHSIKTSPEAPCPSRER
ncbi:MAG: UDP-2,3-diacylglucosamine diphosphatase LpxI [Thermoguttaceae bacterium]|nr:UDP-2,3-diacylglucosamine diphosphatase LpxI [Thermoguttaceae bacterium]MDW8038579.1 UDP-2,3-diacylglucosamine diphosphatase LpxI [Thermoguttaceae bacterium]